MKKFIRSIIIVAAIAGLTTLLPTNVSAADEKKKDEKKEEGKKKDAAIPYTGKLTAVDKAAKTFTIPKDRVIAVTATTRITKGGKPATLDDAAVGEEVAGQYKKGEGEKLEALSLRIGPRAEGEVKGKKKDEKKEEKK